MIILISEGNSFHEEESNPIDPQILSSEIDGQGLLVKENETPSSGENPLQIKKLICLKQKKGVEFF